MKNTIGNNVTVTLFGESHGGSIGAVVDGLPAGIAVDKKYIDMMLSRRRPRGLISSARQEKDLFTIESGVFNGYTTGAPVCIRIENNDIDSKSYDDTRFLARPSHADYTAYCKYNGYEDYRGSGHFSGRLTAALVAAGALVIPSLKNKGIKIGTHISRCGGICDAPFSNIIDDIERLGKMDFPVLDEKIAQQMKDTILNAKKNGDSIGGVLETAVTGPPAGIGEPWFDTVEGMLSHALFSIPAVKGVEFGAGFAIADMKGSEANDEFYIENGKVLTKTNNSGGINGGITNGMPLIFRCAIRPTPTISKEQNTINMKTLENAVISSRGRHDPCIAHRAAVVVDCVTALTVCDMLCGHYGKDFLSKGSKQ